jgi:hypothetical protein
VEAWSSADSRFKASRNTVAKYLDSEVTRPKYKTRAKRAPVMGAWVVQLEAMLAEDAQRPRKEQRTAQRLHDGLLQEGFTGSYPTVQRFVKAWHEEGTELSQPLSVQASGDTPLLLRIDISGAPADPHKNKYGKDYKPQAGESEDERY